ncbi:hypothetical protein [Verminephrobacter aporrectodeae]|uniref:hypothetical protein n=1 Tax=Verminephrobacter aporrectodeae TaxID=1110389 RepID=UPI0022378F67|nr:hypothetical protein [Verminephrobacter aporrectodeae]
MARVVAQAVDFESDADAVGAGAGDVEPEPAPELPGLPPLPGQELLLTENHEVDAPQSDCVPFAHWKSQITFRMLL